MHPVDAISLDEAARILGVARSTAQEWVLAETLQSQGEQYARGRLSRSDVEALAAQSYDWRTHVEGPDSYWLNSHQAASILGVSRQRLGQLADKDFVPYVKHRDGIRLYRREQLLTIANAREARWH